MNYADYGVQQVNTLTYVTANDILIFVIQTLTVTSSKEGI